MKVYVVSTFDAAEATSENVGVYSLYPAALTRLNSACVKIGKKNKDDLEFIVSEMTEACRTGDCWYGKIEEFEME